MDTIEELRSDVYVKEAKNEKLDVENVKLERRRVEMIENYEEMKVEFNKEKNKFEDMKSAFDNVYARYTKCQNDLVIAREQINDAKAGKVAADMESSYSQRRATEEKKRFADTVQDLVLGKQALEQTLLRTDRQLLNLKETSEATIKQLKSRSKKAEDLQSIAEKKAECSKEEYRKLNYEIFCLRQQIGTMRISQEEISSSHKEQMESLECHLNIFKIERAEALSKIGASSNMIAQLNQIKEALKYELDSSREEAQNLARTRYQLKKELQVSHDKIADTYRMASSLSQQNNNLKRELGLSREEVLSLKKQEEEYQRQKTAHCYEHKDQYQSLEKKLATAEQELDVAKELISEFMGAARNFQDKISDEMEFHRAETRMMSKKGRMQKEKYLEEKKKEESRPVIEGSSKSEEERARKMEEILNHSDKFIDAALKSKLKADTYERVLEMQEELCAKASDLVDEYVRSGDEITTSTPDESAPKTLPCNNDTSEEDISKRNIPNKHNGRNGRCGAPPSMTAREFFKPVMQGAKVDEQGPKEGKTTPSNKAPAKPSSQIQLKCPPKIDPVLAKYLKLATKPAKGKEPARDPMSDSNTSRAHASLAAARSLFQVTTEPSEASDSDGESSKGWLPVSQTSSEASDSDSEDVYEDLEAPSKPLTPEEELKASNATKLHAACRSFLSSQQKAGFVPEAEDSNQVFLPNFPAEYLAKVQAEAEQTLPTWATREAPSEDFMVHRDGYLTVLEKVKKYQYIRGRFGGALGEEYRKLAFCSRREEAS